MDILNPKKWSTGAKVGVGIGGVTLATLLAAAALSRSGRKKYTTDPKKADKDTTLVNYVDDDKSFASTARALASRMQPGESSRLLLEMSPENPRSVLTEWTVDSDSGVSWDPDNDKDLLKPAITELRKARRSRLLLTLNKQRGGSYSYRTYPQDVVNEESVIDDVDLGNLYYFNEPRYIK